MRDITILLNLAQLHCERDGDWWLADYRAFLADLVAGRGASKKGGVRRTISHTPDSGGWGGTSKTGKVPPGKRFSVQQTSAGSFDLLVGQGGDGDVCESCARLQGKTRVKTLIALFNRLVSQDRPWASSNKKNLSSKSVPTLVDSPVMATSVMEPAPPPRGPSSIQMVQELSMKMQRAPQTPEQCRKGGRRSEPVRTSNNSHEEGTPTTRTTRPSLPVTVSNDNAGKVDDHAKKYYFAEQGKRRTPTLTVLTGPSASRSTATGLSPDTPTYRWEIRAQLARRAHF
eukprot:sb/3467778/